METAEVTMGTRAPQRPGTSASRGYGITGSIYEEIKNSTNLCRNPGGLALDGPWCFTKNETVQWEYCGVPEMCKRE